MAHATNSLDSWEVSFTRFTFWRDLTFVSGSNLREIYNNARCYTIDVYLVIFSHIFVSVPFQSCSFILDHFLIKIVCNNF